MNITELVGSKLPEIKKLLFADETVEAATEATETTEDTKENFADAKLVDGTIVRVEPALEVGATVQVISEDGSLLEAPDGEHELESGEVVRTEGGVIVEVMEAEVEEEAEEEVEEEAGKDKEDEEYSAEPKFDADAFKEDILSAVSNIVKSEIDAAGFASQKNVEEVTEAVSLVTDIIERMAATPKEAPTKSVHNPFNKGTDYVDMAAKISAVMKANK